ncbi:MAG: glycosyl transferase group [Actinobacteria bacterium]|nr:MAG: glycosyl transferase group [Actinomycetota bacterium]
MTDVRMQQAREQPLRIALLDTGDIRFPYGGQATFLRAVVPHIRHEVVLYTGCSSAVRHSDQTRLGDRAYLTRCVAVLDRPGRRPFLPVRLRALIGTARRRGQILLGSDVVYVHSPEMALPFIWGRRGRALVFHMHGNANPLTHSRYKWARGRFLQWAYRRLMGGVIRSADAVIAVDADGLALCVSYLRDGTTKPMVLVSTAVDDCWFESERNCNEIGDRKRNVVFIGRLEEGKGTTLLIDSLALLMGVDSRVIATIAGEGSERRAMEDQARALGIIDRMTFTGWLEPDEVLGLLTTATVLALPSRSEGMPLCVLEALACGVPVVASAVGALPTIVRDGVNGRLVHDPSAATFARAIEDTLQDLPSASEVSASVSTYRAASIAPTVSGVLLQAYEAASRPKTRCAP